MLFIFRYSLLLPNHFITLKILFLYDALHHSPLFIDFQNALPNYLPKLVLILKMNTKVISNQQFKCFAKISDEELML